MKTTTTTKKKQNQEETGSTTSTKPMKPPHLEFPIGSPSQIQKLISSQSDQLLAHEIFHLPATRHPKFRYSPSSFHLLSSSNSAAPATSLACKTSFLVSTPTSTPSSLPSSPSSSKHFVFLFRSQGKKTCYTRHNLNSSLTSLT